MDLLNIIRVEAVHFGDVTLSSGETSDIYIDKWALLSDPAVLGHIAQRLGWIMPGEHEYLAGPALGGAVLTTALGLHMDMQMLFVRDAGKGYGINSASYLEGAYEPGKKALVVEDVLTTGKAAIETAMVLRNAGLVVTDAIGIVDRQGGARECLAELGIELKTLFTLGEIREGWR